MVEIFLFKNIKIDNNLVQTKSLNLMYKSTSSSKLSSSTLTLLKRYRINSLPHHFSEFTHLKNFSIQEKYTIHHINRFLQYWW